MKHDYSNADIRRATIHAGLDFHAADVRLILDALPEPAQAAAEQRGAARALREAVPKIRKVLLRSNRDTAREVLNHRLRPQLDDETLALQFALNSADNAEQWLNDRADQEGDE